MIIFKMKILDKSCDKEKQKKYETSENWTMDLV